ncbi:hypothetical protein G7054_g734 [Neopestalotiopsis clavispora]|nr:hypothetical protein G7054_g734 [Neopestalotiopsis clavispora]
MDEDAEPSSNVSESKKPLLHGQLNSEACRLLDNEIQSRSSFGKDIRNFSSHTKQCPVLILCPNLDNHGAISRYPIAGSTYKKKEHAKGVSRAVCDTSSNDNCFPGDISADGTHHESHEQRTNTSTSIPWYHIFQVKRNSVFPFTTTFVLLDFKKSIHSIWMKFTSHTLTVARRLFQVLLSNPARAVPHFPMLLLMATRVLASQMDNSVLRPHEEGNPTDDSGSQWQRHVGIYVSSLIWAVVAWGFNRTRDIYSKNYRIWYLSATLLYNAVYGYEIFVELRTSTAASAGLVALIFLVAWTYHDTRRFGPNTLQLLVLVIAILAFFLDATLSILMSSPDAAKSFLFMVLLVPCVTASVCIWRIVWTMASLIARLD